MMPATDDHLSVMDAIRARRSVRAYSPEELDRSTIEKLLAAAVRAPTAIHEESWAFVIVQDRAALERLSDLAKPMFLAAVRRAAADGHRHSFEAFDRPDFNLFYDAGTLIVICAKGRGPFVAADCWLAAGNLMLAAVSMGLGTCVIGSALAALETAAGKAEAGIPDGVTAVAPIIVGVPRGATPESPRKPPEILSWK